MDNNEKKYNEGYIKKWLYFDNMHKSMKQAEITLKEFPVDNIEKYTNSSLDFDVQFNEYLNNNKNISFEEIIENEKLYKAYKMLTDREKLIVDFHYHKLYS